MMRRDNESPRPHPRAFVVNPGVNTSFHFDFGMPFPVSATRTSTLVSVATTPTSMAPVPSIAREYYSGDDVLETFMRTGRGRRSLESLYDVFCEVRDDEGEHWRTLINLVQRDELDGPPEGCSVVGTVERQQQRQQQREREQ